MPITLSLPERLDLEAGDFIQYVEREVFPHRRDLHLVTSEGDICFYQNPGLFAAEILADQTLLLEGLTVDILVQSKYSPSIKARWRVSEQDNQKLFSMWTDNPFSIAVNGVDIEQNHLCCWWLIRTLLTTNRVEFQETLSLFQKIGRTIPLDQEASRGEMGLDLNARDLVFVNSCPELAEEYLLTEPVSIMVLFI